MNEMHSVFPVSAINIEDPILKKKTINKYGQWRGERGLFEWAFERVEKRMVSETRKIKAILATLKG